MLVRLIEVLVVQITYILNLIAASLWSIIEILLLPLSPPHQTQRFCPHVPLLIPNQHYLVTLTPFHLLAPAHDQRYGAADLGCFF